MQGRSPSPLPCGSGTDPLAVHYSSSLKIHELLGSGHFAKVHCGVATRAGLTQGLPLSFVLKEFAGELEDGDAEDDVCGYTGMLLVMLMSVATTCRRHAHWSQSCKRPWCCTSSSTQTLSAC